MVARCTASRAIRWALSGSRVFVDTNVFAYALDSSAGAKQSRAQEVISARRHDIVVSTQVLVELYAVCTSKLGMARSDARAAVEAVGAFPVTDTDRGLALRAITLADRAQLSVFDAAIVCAAQRSSCGAILTEDLNEGQRFGDTVIENPFGA